MISKLARNCFNLYQTAGMPVRQFLLKSLLSEMGDGCRIFSWPKIYYPENIKFGRNITINHGVVLEGRGGIEIGDNVRISPYAILITGYLEPATDERGHYQKPIVIGNDAWLASRSTILAGVTVGEGAVVAAGAVVTKDVPPYHIAVGVPAKCTPIAKE